MGSVGPSAELDLQAEQQVRSHHAACVLMRSDTLLSILGFGQLLSQPVTLGGPVTLVGPVTALFLTYEHFNAPILLRVPSFALRSDALDAHALFKSLKHNALTSRGAPAAGCLDTLMSFSTA